MAVPSFEKRADTGLLLMRVSLGLMMIAHGLPKILQGPETWETIGRAVEPLGISAAFWLWGLLAGATECIGGLLLILGLFSSLALVGLSLVMTVATIYHISHGDSFALSSHPATLGAIFLCQILTGPGRYSLDAAIWKRKPE
ncbi:MAG: DoxX family protein [bacterium]|nr:DoxX family protein [bacterium]